MTGAARLDPPAIAHSPAAPASAIARTDVRTGARSMPRVRDLGADDGCDIGHSGLGPRTASCREDAAEQPGASPRKCTGEVPVVRRGRQPRSFAGAAYATTRPCRMAYRTSVAVSRSLSFLIRLARCHSAVRTDTERSAAACFIDLPAAINRRTSVSRGVSPSPRASGRSTKALETAGEYT